MNDRESKKNEIFHSNIKVSYLSYNYRTKITIGYKKKKLRPCINFLGVGRELIWEIWEVICISIY